jgi:hypothetical protein
MQRMRRFARYWDAVANSGNFVETTPLIWGEGSAFLGFMSFSDWLYGRVGRTHSIALQTLAERLFEYLCEQRGLEREHVAAAMWRDYQRGGRRDKPEFLRPHLSVENEDRQTLPRGASMRRQSRHLAVEKSVPVEGAKE